jgi:hypothetical protein
MHFNKLALEREPDAECPFGLPPVQANLGKQFKDMRQVGRRNADAVISDARHRPIGCTRNPQLYPSASLSVISTLLAKMSRSG